MIFIKNLSKITDEKYSVGFVHFMPFDNINGLGKTQEELLQEGRLIEKPQKGEEVPGKNQVMYYNHTENKCFYEYEDVPQPPEDAKTRRINELEGAIVELTVAIANLTGGVD